MWGFEDYVDRSRRVSTVAVLSSLYSAMIETEGYENSVLISLRGRNIGRIGWVKVPTGYDYVVPHRPKPLGNASIL